MKSRQVIPFILMLLFSTSLCAQMKVKFFVGDSSYRPLGADEWQKINMNQVLSNGDTIKTAEKAYVQLDVDGNQIKINENSIVTIGEDFDDDKRVKSMDMEHGNLQLRMNRLKRANEGFMVNTVASVCAVRGTEFTVASGYDGSTLLQVQKGRVALAGASEEVLVGENQQSFVPYGGNPSEVKTLTLTEWSAWLAESEKNAQGNELSMLKTSLERMHDLEQDIIDLEKIRERNLEEKEEYDKLAKEARTAGREDEFKEYASEAYKSLRYANSALFKTYAKARRTELVRQMAERLHTGVERDERTAELTATYDEIMEIYNRYYEKYTRATIEAQRRRQERRENR